MSHLDVAPPPSGALADDSRREWVSFEHDGDTYLFDASFLTSNWRCIFGNGCKGVLEEDATDLGHGCCSHGAHLADKPDRERVRRQALRLNRDQWQLMDTAADLGGAFHKVDGSWTTRCHDGACIFLNRNDFHLGAGCALHVGALDAGESFAAERGASALELHVIDVRVELIDWYRRRGYVVTDERHPFPYGDERFGLPRRDDLQFAVLRKELTP